MPFQGDHSKCEFLGCESMQDPHGGGALGISAFFKQFREIRIPSDRLGKGCLGFCLFVFFKTRNLGLFVLLTMMV